MFLLEESSHAGVKRKLKHFYDPAMSILRLILALRFLNMFTIQATLDSWGNWEPLQNAVGHFRGWLVNCGHQPVAHHNPVKYFYL